MARMIENPRQLIMEHAKEIMYKEGYKKLSMRNVAKSCKIALGTIYNYYPTKADLVTEMMEEYWIEYFHTLKQSTTQRLDLFSRLKQVYMELSKFLNTFKEVWLSADLYDTPESLKKSLEREDIYMEKLVRFVESILLEEEKSNPSFHLRFSSYEIATFIVANFITIIQMPFFKYESFEKLLKEVL
ncbi:TetR/AcrR family transcriptional regulator [Rubeoparvulum massiliense]|uniref:TetR/AcrR family transcriptional regulator n=1 Tax=Rubeoparvulum massiliense TaxID=1631346 RepID=UPI00065E756D|nr:TetR/AcrR family transcriptional regulator [Rubeoparvulum massiliense]